MWYLCDDTTYESDERMPGQYGTVSQIFEKSFTIVYGTQGPAELCHFYLFLAGSSQETATLFHEAVQIANQWYYFAMGNVTILSDVEAVASPPETSILLLGGNANLCKLFNFRTCNKLVYKRNSRGIASKIRRRWKVQIFFFENLI
jgi:hypothetical protein